MLADWRLEHGMRSIVSGLDSKRSLVKISKKINKVALKIIKTKRKIIKSLTNNTTTGFNLFEEESKGGNCLIRWEKRGKHTQKEKKKKINLAGERMELGVICE